MSSNFWTASHTSYGLGMLFCVVGGVFIGAWLGSTYTGLLVGVTAALVSGAIQVYRLFSGK